MLSLYEQQPIRKAATLLKQGPVEEGQVHHVAAIISLWGYIRGDADTVANDAIGRYTVHDNSRHALKLHSDILIRTGDHLLVHGDANVLVMCYQEQNW